MAFVPLTSKPAIGPPLPSIVMDLVIVTPPKPPGSSTLMYPPVAVLLMAPANVLHGAVRLHGFASSPTPDTHVRVACARAGTTLATKTSVVRTNNRFMFFILIPVMGV